MIDIIDLPLTADREIDAVALSKWLHAQHLDWCFLERVGTLPRDGRVGAFNFGCTNGIIKATLRLSNLEPELVIPQVWKKHFRLIGRPKDASRLRAIELMPSAEKWLQRMKDGGRAESLLIAMYGAEKMLGRARLAAAMNNGKASNAC